METKTIEIKGIDPFLVFGVNDNFLKILRERFPVEVSARGNKIMLKGTSEQIGRLERVLGEMMLTINQKGYVDEKDVKILVDIELGGGSFDEDVTPDTVILFKKDGAVKPRSANQEKYFQATVENDIVFGIGPAGTGKTYLAVAIALAAFRNHDVQRIVLTRPAVEAGENLGYLPGDLKEKIEPYLAPLYDGLMDMLPVGKLKTLMEQKTIEILPLAYMRGRTLNNAFVILDEAQNTTSMQMKMFLTRLGANSKAIITGDITQIDIHDKENSGLIEAKSILSGIEGIKFVYFNTKDVVRHRLVKDIIKAYNGDNIKG